MWKYRVSFRNMINVTFVTGRRGERGGRTVGGKETTETVGSYLCTCSKNSVRIQMDSFIVLVYAPHTETLLR